MSTPAETIAAKFGGPAALADALGCHVRTVTSWFERGGLVPAKKQQMIMVAARDRGINVVPADFFPQPESEAAA